MDLVDHVVLAFPHDSGFMIVVLDERESLHENCLICLLHLLKVHYTQYCSKIMLIEVSHFLSKRYITSLYQVIDTVLKDRFRIDH
jgi:hypothetical protein